MLLLAEAAIFDLFVPLLTIVSEWSSEFLASSRKKKFESFFSSITNTGERSTD